MRRSLQEIVELLVFGLIALLIGTGLLWLVGWVFDLVGGLFKFFAGLIWGLLRFIVPVAIAAAVVYLLVRVLQQRSRDSASDGGGGPSDGGGTAGSTTGGNTTGETGTAESATSQAGSNTTGSAAAASTGSVAGSTAAGDPATGDPARNYAGSHPGRSHVDNSPAANGPDNLEPQTNIPDGDGATTTPPTGTESASGEAYPAYHEGADFGQETAATDEPFDWNEPGEGGEVRRDRTGAGEAEGSEVWTPPQPSPPSEGDGSESDSPFETPDVDRNDDSRFDENRFDGTAFEEPGDDEDRNRND